MSAPEGDTPLLQALERRIAELEAAVTRLTTLVHAGRSVENVVLPVAAAILKERAQHEFSAKFFALLDVGEVVVKYAAATTFGVAADDPASSASVRALYEKPPTLGNL